MKLTVPNLDVDVRAATIDDVPLLLTYIRAMAAFEKLPVSATETSLRESLFGADPVARAMLISVDGKPVGYATYFFTFASMVGTRGLWLDDLFIDAAFRGKGIGRAFMGFLRELAVENRCARFEWMVVDWNTAAIEFYKSLGATVFTNWYTCRLENKLGAQLNLP
jgi:GNAT superfamily N-acetyltransferase